MKKLFYITPLIFLAILVSSLAEAKNNVKSGADTHSVFINLAGKQRMLSQKMAKEASLVSLGVNVEQNINNLRKTANLFDRTLKGLAEGDEGLGLNTLYKGILLRKLEDVNNVWQNMKAPIYKSIKNGSVSNEDIQLINDSNLQVLRQSNIFTQMSEAFLASAGDAYIAKLINVSGRQRMLSQKMAKEFFLIKKEINVVNNRDNLQKTMDEFETSLNQLINGDEKTSLVPAPNWAIKTQLAKIKDIWLEIKGNLSTGVKSQSTYENIINVERLNLLLLKESNEAVTLYTKL